jgi:hypothetical protein
MPSRTSTGPRRWVQGHPPKPKMPALVKSAATSAARELVETVLKPRYVQEPPSEPQWNYIIDIGTRWYHSYLYFIATYCCPGPNALVPSFEHRFARMEFAGQQRFHLSFMRHTNEWIELYQGLSLDECLQAIRDDPFFQM